MKSSHVDPLAYPVEEPHAAKPLMTLRATTHNDSQVSAHSILESTINVDEMQLPTHLRDRSSGENDGDDDSLASRDPLLSMLLESSAQGNVNNINNNNDDQKNSYNNDDEKDAIPSHLLLRHRMGYTLLTLTPSQKRRFTHQDLEDYLLYKEQKYNNINVLGRCCAFLLFNLVLAIVCNAFSLSSTDWRVVEYRGGYTAIGLFVSCKDRLLRECTSRFSSNFDRTVTDSVSGAVVCSAEGSFVRNYIGAMWSMAILELVCELFALVLATRVALRPTRHKSTLAILFLVLCCVCFGIITCVLFPQYTKCDSQRCAARHESAPNCLVRYQWAYHFFIAATALHALALATAICMNRYVTSVRVSARRQLRKARALMEMNRLKQSFVNDVMLSLLADQQRAQGEERAPLSTIWDSVPLSARTRIERDSDLTLRSTQAVESVSGDEVHSGAEPSGNVGGDDRRRSASGTLPFASPRERDFSQSRREEPEYPSSNIGSRSTSALRDHARPSSLGASGVLTPHHMRVSMTLSSTQKSDSKIIDHARTHVKFADKDGEGQGERRARTPLRSLSHLSNSGTRALEGPAATQGGGGGSNRKKADSKNKDNNIEAKETAEYRTVRKQRKKLANIFHWRDVVPDYLTAEELGVSIAGATDWVYDDKSDMYYSFHLDTFWDPLTKEYYNRKLKSWQDTVDHVVEVRDVRGFGLNPDNVWLYIAQSAPT